MHVPKTLQDAIAQGWAVGRHAEVHDRMRVVLTNFLKRKFITAIAAAEDKPFEPAELNELLIEILSGRE